MLMNYLSVIWDFNPIFFSIGSIEVRYYGLMWAMTFAVGLWLFAKFIKQEGLPESVLDKIFWYGTLSTIIGARAGHCLFYEPMEYLYNPISILNIREGGLASHGAAIGLLIGLWLFSRSTKLPYIWSLDRIMLVVCIGGAMVRMGNLFNSEIYGVETSLPWGFIFVKSKEIVPKHPTQIYEALCYIAGFVTLYYMFFKKDMGRKYPGLIFGVGLLFIFLSRFFIEYMKNPQVAFELNMSLLMGQWLSVPFVILGIVMIILAVKKNERSR